MYIEAREQNKCTNPAITNIELFRDAPNAQLTVGMCSAFSGAFSREIPPFSARSPYGL
jgi:hypothetical protein